MGCRAGIYIFHARSGKGTDKDKGRSKAKGKWKGKCKKDRVRIPARNTRPRSNPLHSQFSIFIYTFSFLSLSQALHVSRKNNQHLRVAEDLGKALLKTSLLQETAVYLNHATSSTIDPLPKPICSSSNHATRPEIGGLIRDERNVVVCIPYPVSYVRNTYSIRRLQE